MTSELQPADLLSVVQAAEVLGLAPRSVLGRIQRGTIAATKLGPATSAYVITRAEVERVLAETATAAPEAS